MRRILLWLPVLLGVGGCSLFHQPDHFGSRPLTFEQLAGWPQDSHVQALATFKASCELVAQRQSVRASGSGLEIPPAVWWSLCRDAAQVPQGNEAQARAFFERRFVPYRVNNNGRENGLFTGYYVPVLHGSLTRHGDFIYPLYRKPPELAKGAYYTHAQINQGILAKRGLELVWVDDPVMRFFLQIQGSGVITLGKGKTMWVGYAGQNNQPYVSLGKVMGDENILPRDDINFFTLRQWLYQHPDRAFALMERNPSYVFFRKLDRSGAVGAVGSVLIPGRSLAVDSSYIPYGLPVFMETDLPSQSSPQPEVFDRTLIAQDTGGAIRGPVRGDIFFGTGSDAEYLAGYMKGHGVYSLLVPKEVAYQLSPPEK